MEERPSFYNKVKSRYYIVRPGDTLTKISVLFGSSVKEILQHNDFLNKDSILSPGMTVEIQTK